MKKKMNKNFELLRSIEQKNNLISTNVQQMAKDVSTINRNNAIGIHTKMTLFSDGSSNFNQNFTGVDNDFAVIENTHEKDAYIEFIQFAWTSAVNPPSNQLFDVIPVYVSRMLELNAAGNVVTTIYNDVSSFFSCVEEGFAAFRMNLTGGKLVTLTKSLDTPIVIPPNHYLAFELKEDYTVSAIRPPSVHYYYYP